VGCRADCVARGKGVAGLGHCGGGFWLVVTFCAWSADELAFVERVGEEGMQRRSGKIGRLLSLNATGDLSGFISAESAGLH
jgi:hypothetical protein